MNASSSITSSDLPLAAVRDGVRVAVRLTPRGRVDRIEAIAVLADGTPVLKASVTAPPADSRANDALLRLLAAEWRIPRRDLAIVAGPRSRTKSVLVRGDPARLLAQLASELDRLARS